jgi:Uma2 family endonuclease
MAVETRVRPDDAAGVAVTNGVAPQVPAKPTGSGAPGTWQTAVVSLAGDGSPIPLPIRRFTVDEYYRMAEAGILHADERVELLDGVVVVRAANGPPHASTTATIGDALRDALDRSVAVREQLPVRLDVSWEPEPDVAVVLAPHSRYRRTHPGPQEVLLLVEVADSSVMSDRRVKVPRYAQAGVTEVWLANLSFETDVVTGEPLTERVLEVYRQPGPDGYAEVRVLRAGETVAPQAFPDVAISVADLLGIVEDEDDPDDDAAGTPDP